MKLFLRPAQTADAPMLWQWRNDPVARANSFDSQAVPWRTHVAWLEQKLHCSDCRIWLLESDQQVVGQIRYERRGDLAEASFIVAPSQRGKGFGTALLNLSSRLACNELDVERLIGVVKADNKPSSKAFMRAGYAQQATQPGSRTLTFELSCPTL